MDRAILGVMAGAGFLAVVAIPYGLHNATLEQTQIVVTGKERITERSGDSISSKYLVFTDSETFENTDTIWGWKWNSSDIYGKLEKGQICNVTVTGFRVPFLSWYRNIITANCQTPDSNLPKVSTSE